MKGRREGRRTGEKGRERKDEMDEETQDIIIRENREREKVGEKGTIQ